MDVNNSITSQNSESRYLLCVMIIRPLACMTVLANFQTTYHRDNHDFELIWQKCKTYDQQIVFKHLFKVWHAHGCKITTCSWHPLRTIYEGILLQPFSKQCSYSSFEHFGRISFVSRPTIRLLQSMQGPTSQGCINRNIIVGICSELLVRLPYFIHLGFGNFLWLTWESNLGPSDRESSSTLPLDQSANFFVGN